MFFKKVPFISIDIETKNLTKKEIEFESQFLKAHPSTKDPEKIAAQIATKTKALSTKGALTNTCEIASIAIHSAGTGPLVIHATGFDGDLDDYNVKAFSFLTEAEMLAEFTEIFNVSCDEETVIVVAGKYFDLPKIRYACLKNRVPMAEAVKPGAPNQIYDVLFMGGKYFMVGGGSSYSLSLDELSERLGLNSGGKVISGKEVPGMIERGEFEEVIVYNALDAVKNSEAYLLMTGQY